MVIQSYKNKKEKATPEDVITTRYHMRKHGIVTYDNKSIIRTLVGVCMVGVGVATLFIPFTTIPLCMGGAGLIGYDLRALLHRVRYESHLIKIRSQNRFKLVRLLLW